MADFKIDGRMKVKTLKSEFKKCFGASLRVYTTAQCKTPASDDATLASLAGQKVSGSMTVGGNLRVGNFEKKFTEAYGIGVQVANAADTKLANNDITLVAAGK